MPDPAAERMADHILGGNLPLGPEQPCPYLPDRQARHGGFITEHLHPDVYHVLMDRGFRRSGLVFYRPSCDGCSQCRPLRVVVDAFTRSRSQQRVWRRNQDLRVRLQAPRLTIEKWRLYRRYQENQHNGTMGTGLEDLRQFLYQSAVNTAEIVYYLNDTLVGVSIVDVAARALSSVYMFFDPQYAERSLGTYSALWEIDHCRRRGIPYYYLGYYIRDCVKMNYKARFGAHELLGADGRWAPPAGGPAERARRNGPPE